MLLARKHDQLIGSRGYDYLMREIATIVMEAHAGTRTVKQKRILDISKYESRVDKFVATNIIPVLKHRTNEETMSKNVQFLQQQTQWQRFVLIQITLHLKNVNFVQTQCRSIVCH